MEFFERLFKNKTFRYLFIGLFVFFGINFFQQYAFFFLAFLVIAIMVESGSKDAQTSKKEKLVLRLRDEGESYRGIREQTGLGLATIRRIITDNEKVEVGIK